MSLVAWYPLNKDLRENGSGIGAPIKASYSFANEGKIGGKSLTGAGVLYEVGDTFLDNEWSICTWVKCPRTWTQNNEIIFCYNISTMADSQIYFSVLGGNKLNISFNGKTVQYNMTFNITDWYHIGASYDGTVIRLFVNGEVVHKVNSISTISTHGKYLGIGCRSSAIDGSVITSGTNYKYINDLRIYNHVLSDAEIKEISKAKILHYNFESVYGNPNLLDTSYIFSRVSNTFTIKSRTNGGEVITNAHGSDTYVFLKPIESLIVNEYYTLSFDCYNIEDDSILPWAIDNRESIGKIYLQTGRNSITFKCDSTIAGKSELLFDDLTRTWGENQQNFTLSKFKLEKGKVNTPYCPSSTDDEYDSELATTMYDISGYENNGEISNVTFSNNSKSGNMSGIFKTNSNSGISFGDLGIHSWNISYGCWLYKEDWSQWERNESILNVRCNGLVMNVVIENHSALGLKTALFLAERNDYAVDETISTEFYQCGYSLQTSSLSSGWHHFFATCSEDILNCYIDGERTFWDTGLENYSVTNHPDGYVGKRLTSEGSYSFNGLIDDVRIYATTLTDEDVYRIYKERVKVDNIGNVYCNELDEEERVVEYLESTGTQYIDTEVKVTTDLKVKITAQINNDLNSVRTALFGRMAK